ncbi:hypothetical protein STCU_11549 [Strigomonas culicis]|uniref:Uncharacterized protein n=1 Tax=Strigomonas culicis TaxID=28005 RepID=S9TGU6_9TRYP|nr:hypothetical protein STCU_11549 [Strigomonas culicis]|eukprot:EPY16104.1 hypothetical protein STCU_11549 [Strigomonas culicis]
MTIVPVLVDAALWTVLFVLLGAPLRPVMTSGDDAVPHKAAALNLHQHPFVCTPLLALYVSARLPVRLRDCFRVLLPCRGAARDGEEEAGISCNSSYTEGDEWCFCGLVGLLVAGGLASSLDWQLPYFVWPVPSLLLFLVGEALVGLARWARWLPRRGDTRKEKESE